MSAVFLGRSKVKAAGTEALALSGVGVAGQGGRHNISLVLQVGTRRPKQFKQLGKACMGRLGSEARSLLPG